MEKLFSINLSSFESANNLWPSLISRIGLDKAHKAIRQAKDLQLMNGSTSTMPILILETCGVALINIESLKFKTEYNLALKDMVLILSRKQQSLQLIRGI